MTASTMTIETERQEIAKGKAGDMSAIWRVVMSHEECVNIVARDVFARSAKPFGRVSLTADDLAQDAFIFMSTNVFRAFDVSRGNRFWTFSGRSVYRFMYRQISRYGGVITGPCNFPAESATTFDRWMKTSFPVSMSGSNEGDEFTIDIHDEGEPPVDRLIARLEIESLRDAMKGETGRDGLVLRRRASGKTLKQIGVELNLTKERVRQLESRVLKRVSMAVRKTA